MEVTPEEMQRTLDPSEFAFYFMTETGIEAGDLGDFLKRTATIARHEGAELRVVGFENGSLFVVFKAIKKKARKTVTQAHSRDVGLGSRPCICLSASFDLSISRGFMKEWAEHEAGSKMGQYQTQTIGRAENLPIYSGIEPQPCIARGLR